ncbi:MAG: sugar ABC transporter ATP-binding protein [Oscillospiraceae bacterium]|nr:sugar ABC transporter ATP-binding protein [Oscillospiraceae bacterium]
MGGRAPLLEMKNISKRFPGTLAVDSVNFDVYPGEVHVLMGENGAGKSTLVKIISGILERDEGEMIYDGVARLFKGVKGAQEAGINIIHQELNLLSERSIAQNIFVGREPIKKGLPGVVDKKKMMEDSRTLLTGIGLDLDPGTLVKNLSIAQQQMVEVSKSLSTNLKLLIMDEPTSSLTNKEIDKLFEIIERLKRQDIAIIYISHRMDEIKRVGDRVSILRDGRHVDTISAADLDMDDVIRKMVGRTIEKMYERDYNTPGDEILRTENLTGLRFRNVNISVRAGEIVCLSGLIGAGRTELAKAIFGYDPIIEGIYHMNGQKVTSTIPKRSVKRGIAFLPEDRKAEGLHLMMPIRSNAVMASLSKVFPKRILNTRKERVLASHYREELRIVSPNVEKLVFELSGGNQQKVVVTKWLASKGKLFIFDEPTRGIDVGAKAEIYQILNTLAKEGCGILMISSELNEVIGLSDRVYVMREGEIAKELDRAELDQETIIKYAVGGETKHVQSV